MTLDYPMATLSTLTLLGLPMEIITMTFVLLSFIISYVGSSINVFPLRRPLYIFFRAIIMIMIVGVGYIEI